MRSVCSLAEEVGQCAFRTARESYTLNVRQFGAVGDGVHDDTAAICGYFAIARRMGEC